MDIVIPLATAFAALGLVLASAVWVNRRYSFSVTPPPAAAEHTGRNAVGTRTRDAQAVPASSVLLS
jgi:hypothetical protein